MNFFARMFKELLKVRDQFQSVNKSNQLFLQMLQNAKQDW